ncbi:MAG: hypothetical protein ACYCU0_11665 [Solirubrobacteraceae bacterium]
MAPNSALRSLAGAPTEIEAAVTAPLEDELPRTSTTSPGRIAATLVATDLVTFEAGEAITLIVFPEDSAT